MRPSQLLNTVGHLALAGASSLPLNRRGSGTTLSLVATQFGSIFDVPMIIGGQTFQMQVDTGSSDTYVMRTGYTCVNGTEDIPQEQCLYANRTYHNTDTYQKIPDQNFGITYGAGTASGVMAYEDVSIGGINVKGQIVGISDKSEPMGDLVNSGLLGLAYPSLVSAHPGDSSPVEMYWFNRLIYDPVLFHMHKQGSIDPYFSLALARTPQNASTGFGGYMTIGGLPPVNHGRFTTVPVEITTDIPLNFTSDQRVLSYWSTTIKEVIYGESSDKTTTYDKKFQAFVDSGNSLSFLPGEVVDPINALFDPPAVFDPETKYYTVDCSAKPPAFGLTIGDQTFYHSGADMIYQTSAGVCISSLSRSEDSRVGEFVIHILGDSFLKNVLTVFDFGKNEMRFAKMMDGVSNSTASTGLGNGTVPLSPAPPASPASPTSPPTESALPFSGGQALSWQSCQNLLLGALVGAALVL